MGWGLVTEFCNVLGFLTDCVSSCYYGDAHEPRHPKHFVNVDVAAFAYPFPSALACVLFFHDASVPLRYLPTKMKQKWNDHVCTFCVILGFAQVTYRELIECDALGEHIKIRTNPVREHEGTAARC